MKDGKPVEHECHVLPPASLEAEQAGQFDKAQRILQDAKPLRVMRRGVRASE